ncbi:MAG: DUF1205 domain-containing protein [Nocardioides alkalitolerans]
MTALGERTHVLPLVPVAWALRAAGHDVTVATPPRVLDVVTGAGLRGVPLGRDHRAYRALERLDALERGADGPAAGATSGFAPAAVRRRTWPEWQAFYRENVGLWWRLMNDPLVPDLVALLERERPDLVLWEGFTWAGSIAATAAGVPHARVLSGSDLLTPARRRYRKLAAAADPAPDPVLGWLGGRLASLGRRGGADEHLLTGLATVDYLPPALNPTGAPAASAAPAAPAASVLPVRYVPSNGRAVLPAWLRSRPRRPRVCVTLGQSSITNHGRYGVALRDVLLGVAALDVEVVATVPADLHASVGPLPAHVRLASFVPLDALAATCSAVVDHGGAATMCTVARHGVPQLVVPDDTYDEAVLGDLLARSGSGLTCPPEQVDAASVTAAVDRLLHDRALRAGAARLAGEMAAMPPPAALVPQLEALAA